MPILAAGGGQGDLYVFVRVKEHKELRREGLTVHSDVSVSFVDAILGGHTSNVVSALVCLLTAIRALQCSLTQ